MHLKGNEDILTSTVVINQHYVSPQNLTRIYFSGVSSNIHEWTAESSLALSCISIVFAGYCDIDVI